MPKREELSNHQKMKVAFFILFSAGVFYFAWRVFEPYILMLVTALVFAIVIAPIHGWMTKVLKQHEKISAFTLTLLSVALIGLPLFLFSYFLINQIGQVIASLQAHGAMIDPALFRNPWFQLIPVDVQNLLRSLDLTNVALAVGKYAAANVGLILSGTAYYSLMVFLFFFSLYYFLAEREYLYKKILRLSPLSNKVDMNLINRLTFTVRGVLLGNVIVGVIQGILAGIGFALAGLPNAIIWSLLTILAAQVPSVGTGLVTIPASAYLFLTGHTYAALGLLIWGILIVGTIDNFLKPKLLSGQTNMNALLIFLAMLGGIQIFGPIGFVLGPAIVAAALALLEIYESGILGGKVKL
ncbi:MAG: AI-2E family transporter [bacterium]